MQCILTAVLLLLCVPFAWASQMASKSCPGAMWEDPCDGEWYSQRSKQHAVTVHACDDNPGRADVQKMMQVVDKWYGKVTELMDKEPMPDNGKQEVDPDSRLPCFS